MKSVMDLIKEDSFLSQKMTYEEFENSTQTGVDDSQIEEAYEAYKEIKDKYHIKPKGLSDYLREDPSLTRKITYEEFKNSEVSGASLDDGIEEAYNAYKEILDSLNSEDCEEIV